MVDGYQRYETNPWKSNCYFPCLHFCMDQLHVGFGAAWCRYMAFNTRFVFKIAKDKPILMADYIYNDNQIAGFMEMSGIQQNQLYAPSLSTVLELLNEGHPLLLSYKQNRRHDKPWKLTQYDFHHGVLIGFDPAQQELYLRDYWVDGNSEICAMTYEQVESALNDFARLLPESPGVLYMTEAPSSGKTSLMKQDTCQLLFKNIQEMKQYRDYMLERLDGEEWTDPSYISILFDFLFIDLRAFRRFDEMALEERGMAPTIQKAFANCMEWLDAVCNTYFKLKNSNRLRDHQKFIEILGSYIEADEHLVEQLFPANSSTEVRTCL